MRVGEALVQKVEEIPVDPGVLWSFSLHLGQKRLLRVFWRVQKVEEIPVGLKLV